jgi:hypothetical protein
MHVRNKEHVQIQRIQSAYGKPEVGGDGILKRLAGDYSHRGLKLEDKNFAL